MKNLIAVILFAVVGLSSQARVIFEGATQTRMIEYSNQLVQGGPLVTRTYLEVSYASCGAVDISYFNVNAYTGRDGENYVEIGIEPHVDCMGPMQTRKYTIQTKKIKDSNFIVLNPTRVKTKSMKDIISGIDELPKVCPAVACPGPGMIKDSNCKCTYPSGLFK